MVLLKRLMVFVALITSASLEDSCDEEAGWVEFDGKCYYISDTVEETGTTWHEAHARCRQEGGDLTSIHSSNETWLVFDLADELGYTGDLWIGLNQLEDKEQYRWSDGTTSEYSDWVSGHPIEDGLFQCVYQPGKPFRGFVVEENVNAIKGLLNNPHDADGVNTFYLGYTGVQGDDPLLCQDECQKEPRCSVFTYFYNNYPGPPDPPDTVWFGECVGRTDFQDVWEPEDRTASGRFELSGNSWFSANCGLQKGFVCKKDIGSDNPHPVPPTDPVPGYCPAGYFSVDGDNKCYKMVEGTPNTEGEGWSWSEARERCRSVTGGDLASIHSAEQNAIITTRLQNFHFGFWLGHYGVGDEWVWSDNSQVDFTNWADERPGQNYGKCAEVWTEDSQFGRWNNRDCSQKRGYICQVFKDKNSIIVTPPSTTPHSCPDGWTPYWYACYLYEDTRLTWQEAQNRCHDKDSQLVSFAGAAENAAASLMAGSNVPYWIGLKQSEEGEFKWTDGWPVAYTNWAAEEPGNGEGCTSVDGEGTWVDSDCDEGYSSVCKRTDVPPPTTPADLGGLCAGNGWVPFGDYCYYFHSGTASSWEDAEHQCITHGGTPHPDATLTSVHSIVENEFIFTRSKELNPGKNIWIGLFKDGLNSPFKWTDGSPVNFDVWAPGEPNDVDGTENCVEIYTQTWPALWNDRVCNSYDRTFVCKASKIAEPSPPPEVPGTCPGDSWIPRAEFCFYFNPDVLVTWEAAKEQCEEKGGEGATLASIHDQQENGFVWHYLREYSTSPVYPNAWIGLVREDPEEGHDWLWDDESTVVYTNWAVGGGGDLFQRCGNLFLSDGKWDGENCFQFQGYVCKVKKAGTESGLSTGDIVGIVFGVLIGLAVIGGVVFAVWYFVLRRRSSKKADDPGFSNETYANFEDDNKTLDGLDSDT